MVITIKNIDEYLKKYKLVSGILCPNGELHTCSYMGHSDLCTELFSKGLVSSSSWVNAGDIFHISSNSLSGTLAYSLNYIEDWDTLECLPNISEAQYEMLRRMPHLKMYSSEPRDPNLGEMCLRYHIAKTNRGGKYGTLSFIKSLWANIKTPNLDVNGIIRSSPTKSIPGALFSKVGDIEQVGEELKMCWDNLPNILTTDNKLHYFSQEFIEGLNGVFHYRKGKFTYQCSDEQGSVVAGKSKSIKVNPTTRKYLKEIGKVFSEYFERSVQCEFVVPTGDEVPVIVQLRLLNAEYSTLESSKIPDDALFTGKSFCSYVPYGKWYNKNTCKGSDILVVDEDCEDTTKLVGKKLLIVKKNMEFSHILALSKALNIPSMYDISNRKIKLDPEQTYEFDTTCEIGYLKQL